jgi:hypothetical protein
MSRMRQTAWSRKRARIATSRSAISMRRRSVCMTAYRSARVPAAFAGAGSAVRVGLAHRDNLILVDAGAQRRRDPFDVRLESVRQFAVLFGRRRRRVGHQQKLGLCIDQRGGRGPESEERTLGADGDQAAAGPDELPCRVNVLDVLVVRERRVHHDRVVLGGVHLGVFEEIMLGDATDVRDGAERLAVLRVDLATASKTDNARDRLSSPARCPSRDSRASSRAGSWGETPDRSPVAPTSSAGAGCCAGTCGTPAATATPFAGCSRRRR